MVNNMKTVLLLGLLTGIILFIGSLWGEQGLIMAFVLSVLMNFASYFFSDRIALAMYGARPVTREEAPRLYAIVEYLCSRAALPMPKLYIIPSDSPNAFATGRNPQHASVAVTEGALRLLDEEEMRGVLAHEISHVRNRDILTSSVAATLAGAIMMIARIAFFFGGSRDREEGGGAGGILMIILAPIAALFIQMWISRTREYEADRSGAEILGDPRGLASALQKLDAYSKRLPMQEAAPATAHLFIVHPFSGSSLLNLFSTHPPLEKRIERLLRKPH
ncbi:MAG: protease HtpX [Acidobacteria bacterium]|nr:MAG: protease HtpX [Acidobacteriota bacterium]